MPQYTKPNFTSVWADTGSKTEPTTAKINQGWIVEIPPHEMMNWLQNRQDQFLAHVNQMGIPQWDANTEYQAQKSYVQGTSGIIYRALQTHTNRNPDTDVNGFWSVAFESAGLSLLKAQNLADVPDKPLARQNLGIASTSDYDARYLLKNSNFADVPNKASARNNLGLGGSSVLNVGNTAATVAAGDDTRIVNAVQSSRVISAGAGLSGGGSLTEDRVLSLGTPSSVSATSGNSLSGGTHSHSLDVQSFLPTQVTDVTSSRTYNTLYTNTRSKHIFVSIMFADAAGGNLGAQLFVNSIRVGYLYAGVNNIGTLSYWIPPGGTYRVVRSDTNDYIVQWTEMV